MRAKFIICLVSFIFLIGVFKMAAFNGSRQQDVGNEKILGDWDMEVNAGGEYYYLTFTIEETDENLTGSISESSGFFSDVALANVEFDGETLLFEMTIPTPPDGIENLVSAELELVEERLEGTLTVEVLGISVPAAATKKNG